MQVEIKSVSVVPKLTPSRRLSPRDTAASIKQPDTVHGRLPHRERSMQGPCLGACRLVDFSVRWSGGRSDSAAGHATAAPALLPIRHTPTGNKLPLRNTRTLLSQSRQPRVWPRKCDEVITSDTGRAGAGRLLGSETEASTARSPKRPEVTEGYMHVFISADRGWGVADITLGYSQWHRDTNYGFNLLLRLELTPLHLVAAIFTCDILTISLKSLVLLCLNFFFSLCSLNSHSPIQRLDILTKFTFFLRSPCLTLSLLPVFLISLLESVTHYIWALWWWGDKAYNFSFTDQRLHLVALNIY